MIKVNIYEQVVINMGWGKFLGLVSIPYSTQWVKLRGQGGKRLMDSQDD